MWNGKACYIIGGGPSLRSFDWSLLEHEHVIGCNAVFLLPPGIVDVLLFGDRVFLDTYEKELEAFDGLVVTCLPSLVARDDGSRPWLGKMCRQPRGLGVKNTLAWNGNTGAAAINLALLFGAQCVYLLGFDMRLQDGENNWHDKSCFKPKEDVFQRFLRGFDYLAEALPKIFPGRRVVNVTDDSDLHHFSKEALCEHFASAAGIPR